MQRPTNNATENKNLQSATTTATESKPKATTEKKAVKWSDLTAEQQKQGKALLYIMERREVGGVRQLSIDKSADPIRIYAAEGLDEKATLRATGRISMSARRDLGGKYNADAHEYTFPRKDFIQWVAYYKAAAAEGITTLDAKTEKPKTEKPKTEKPKTEDAQASTEANPTTDTLITKADALARCRKALAIALTKEMIECMEDEIKALFA